jgi:hypothetical protein
LEFSLALTVGLANLTIMWVEQVARVPGKLMPTQLPASPTETRNSRLGLFLFTIYFAIYAAYVILNSFYPDVIEQVAWTGLNVAVIYGLGLILGAFLFALLYALLCKSPPRNEL